MASCNPYVEEFRKTGYFAYLESIGARPEAPRTSELWRKAMMEVCPVGRNTPAPILFEAIANPADIDASRQHFVTMSKAAGFSVVCGLIQQLQVKPNGVFLDGQRIQTVYTMFTWSELRRFVPYEMIRRLAEADEAGLVDFIAPPTCDLFDNKANFKILSSDTFAAQFSPVERALLSRYLPRTFRLTEERIEETLRDRVDLVLKPAWEYGGKGVTFGAQVSAGEWEQVVRTAARTPKAFVCQQMVTGLWRRSVAEEHGTERYFVCLGPIVLGGEYAGLTVRQLRDGGVKPVINGSYGAEAGAGVVHLDA